MNLSPITFGVILPPKLHGKILANSQIIPTTLDQKKNSKVHTINILLESGASESIIRKNVLYKRHKILKDKKNKWSTMAGIFNTTFVTEIIVKLLKLNNSAKNKHKMPFD